MTLLEWIGTGLLDFAMSVAGIVVALHFDLEGRWDQRAVRHGHKLDERERAKRLDSQPPVG
jgi:hypothetical protein